MDVKKLRNIGIIAHVDAGKTTVSERILYYTGQSHRIGEVHNGNAIMDFDPQEQARGITINSAATTVFWNGYQVNLIDTPGHIDFNIEVNRSLRVLDGAVVVLDGVAGVEPQTETNWRLADQYHVPRLCFINKLDRVGADVYPVFDQIRDRLGARPLVLQLPIGTAGTFAGVIDLVTMQARIWPAGSVPGHYETRPIPEAMVAQAERYHTLLVEQAVEQDDTVLAAYLEGETPSADRLRACIRKGVINGAFVPVLMGAAYKNVGIEPLLDAVASYLPAPGEVAGIGQPGIASDDTGPFVGLAFKVTSDDHGSLTFVRVYRGTLAAGEVLLNANTGLKERVSRLYEMFADKKQECPAAPAGSIVALAGLKATVTGDTLTAPGHPVVLERIAAADPVIEVAVEARTQADQQQLLKGLQTLVQEDPSLRLRQDPESGQTLLAGMGELQLEVTLEKLRSRFRAEALVGKPQVAYRETIARPAEVTHLLRKQTGGAGQYAEVRLRLEPLAPGDGIQFESRVVGGAIPREYIPAVEAGVRKAAQAGPLAGFECVDLKATLLDGRFHEKDSSLLAFELAGLAAFREAAGQAAPVLLEPVMSVEVTTPVDYMGACIGDLHRRRGQVSRQEQRGQMTVLEALVPLQEMFGYIGDLRALSSGRASYTMQFHHYQAVPQGLAAEIIRR